MKKAIVSTKKISPIKTQLLTKICKMMSTPTLPKFPAAKPTKKNQTSCNFYDLSYMTLQEFDLLMDALKAGGLLDDDDQT